MTLYALLTPPLAVPTSLQSVAHAGAAFAIGLTRRLSGAFKGLMTIGLLLLISPVEAAINVSGSITSNTTWTAANSPYTVAADVTIDNGSTLTIEAGVTVYFTQATHFIINSGSVIARAKATQPILFTSVHDVTGATPAAGDWGQVRFKAGTISNSTEFDGVEFRYGSGLKLEAASPTLNRIRINNMAGPAITSDLASSPKGIGLSARDNILNGIKIPAGDITGSVNWALTGIPYVIESGTVGVGLPPTLTNIAPAIVQAGQTVDATLTGTRLTSPKRISVDRTDVTATLLPGGTSTEVPVRFNVDSAAAAGSVTLSLLVAAGQVSIPFSITAFKPIVSVVPSPIAIAPNSSANITVRLSAPTSVPLSLAVETLNPSVATVAQSTLTIPAGQMSALLNLSGLATGQTVLRLSASDYINPIDTALYVTTEIANLNAAYTPVLSIIKGDPTATAVNQMISSSITNLIKGDPSAVNGAGAAYGAVVQIIKGDPTEVNVGVRSAVSPGLGISK